MTEDTLLLLAFVWCIAAILGTCGLFEWLYRKWQSRKDGKKPFDYKL
jgi:Na+/H+ antiporter NhaD/arsenite permease-like protein